MQCGVSNRKPQRLCISSLVRSTMCNLLSLFSSFLIATKLFRLWIHLSCINSKILLHASLFPHSNSCQKKFSYTSNLMKLRKETFFGDCTLRLRLCLVQVVEFVVFQFNVITLSKFNHIPCANLTVHS